ncbi:BTAD domain-containing putative transcriptional regulator [Solwaraspora sp. WMMD1047]|uniref:BTAD domain-containing putative transcriptional regulator n=1 Tax=Solwaraspora sp. WMMD1047 TaxID=3016102 RepID=UPI0024168431|nr:BTAD domain-containing putative transcriptional regulator [Solwaraspora sp. WMMD1047]MDG4832052.1 BTAD domain-containing putative transcriptional regulator [Solwaraspora sp. WMMD1047]
MKARLQVRRSVPERRGTGTTEDGRSRFQVRLLGPVELTGPNGPVVLPGAARPLLGLLALRPGEPVTVAELLDALHPDQPFTAPADAGAPVGLGRAAEVLAVALADAGRPDALRVRPGGYLLDVPADEVDAGSFGALADRARRRAAAGDPGGALPCYAEALACWRAPMGGGPLTGHRLRPTGWAAAAAARLAQMRVAVTEERWDAALRLAAAAALAAGGSVADAATVAAGEEAVRLAGVAEEELATAVTAHPLRARLWELLLVATFIGRGRRAAIDVGRRAGVVFQEQLGVEPATRLAELITAAELGDPGQEWLVAGTPVDQPGGPPPTRSTPTGPTATGPAPTGLAPSGPALTGPAPTGPALTGLTPTGPAPTGLGPAGSASTGLVPIGCAPTGSDLTAAGALEPAGGAVAAPVTAVPGSAGPAGAARPPDPLTPLLGRDELRTVVAERLAEHRLVTLVGPGGAGKTRLALAVAAGRPECRFVDLSVVESPVRVPEAVAAALGLPAPSADTDAVGLLIDRLATATVLLVLDNCEHVVAGCAELATRLLDRCPGLRVLATSRTPLRLSAELTVAVPPLAGPPAGSGHTIASLAAHPASRLFLDRARACSGRPVPEESADAVARLCVELDGLPLAIELAAARTPMLDVREILARLGTDQRLLRSSDPTAPDRHRTLAAAIDSSVEQLDPEARTLLERLAVWSGGFPAEAATAICGPAGPAALAALVDASLVEPIPTAAAGPDPASPDPAGPDPAGPAPVSPGPAAADLMAADESRYRRFRMLMPIRRHAAHLLTYSGAEFAARQALAAYCLALAERADARLRGPEQQPWLRRLRAEAVNLRSALAWLAEAGAAGEPYGDLRLAAALAMYHRLDGRYGEGLDWLAKALHRHPGAPAPLRARAGVGAAMLAMLRCDYPAAAEHAEAARAACRATGDRRGEARVELILGSAERERANYAKSSAHLASAAAIFAEQGDEWGEAQTVQLRGFTAWISGDLDRADSRLRSGLHRCERLGDPEAVASALMNLGAVALYRGDIDRASSLLDAALHRYAALGFPEGVGWAHNLRGVVELRAGRTDRAGRHLALSLAAHREVGDRWRMASVLEALAEVARLGGEPVRGARLLGAAARIRAEIGAPVPACERPDTAATERALRARLNADDPEGFRAAHRYGWEAPLDVLVDGGSAYHDGVLAPVP